MPDNPDYKTTKPRRFWRIRFRHEKADLWIGAYWKRELRGVANILTVYICFVPMLPLVIQRTTYFPIRFEEGWVEPDEYLRRADELLETLGDD